MFIKLGGQCKDVRHYGTRVGPRNRKHSYHREGELIQGTFVLHHVDGLLLVLFGGREGKGMKPTVDRQHTVRRDIHAVALCVLVIAFANPCVAYAEEEPTGPIWTVTHMDVNVVLRPEEEALRTSGNMTLRCDAESSMELRLALNNNHAVLEFVTVEGANAARVELNLPNPKDAAVRYAQIEFLETAKRGDEVQLRFVCEGTGKGYQIRIDPDVATASWVDVWYPYPDDDSGCSLSQRMSVAGTTVIRMPAGWQSLSEGQLVRRTQEDDEAVEEWRLDVPMARSFAAGPYQVARHRIGDREVGVYLLTADAASARRQAEVLGQAIEELEKRFGAFPFPSYGIAEVPAERYEWSAASLQGFIIADSHSFKGPNGNLPLFAHEAAHAWWGNLVGTKGLGAAVCSESMAQYGAVLALEGVLGVDAATEFLRFGAPGNDPAQCAKGYFEIIAIGEDCVLSQATYRSGSRHDLFDAKGHWVYHMLRQRVGDEVFFATLRSLIDTYRGREMSLDDARAAFIRAAGPEKELESFFEQWLDRTGAPDLELQWTYSRSDRGGLVEGSIRQIQPGEPYHLFVTLAMALSGSPVSEDHVVEIRTRLTEFSVVVKESVDDIVLDPHHHILMWRPEYESSSLSAVLWVAIVALAVAMLVFFRRRKWLGLVRKEAA